MIPGAYPSSNAGLSRHQPNVSRAESNINHTDGYREGITDDLWGYLVPFQNDVLVRIPLLKSTEYEYNMLAIGRVDSKITLPGEHICELLARFILIAGYD